MKQTLSPRWSICLFTSVAVLALLVFLLAGISSAQAETLNNASIIELQGLGLGDAVILEKIGASTCDFDISVDGLKKLKAAKVSDPVMKAMIATKSTTAVAPAPQPAAPAGDVNDPAAAHDSGVWFFSDADGAKKMETLTAESYRIWSGAGPFGGATRAVLDGIASKSAVPVKQPVFYMYFPAGTVDAFGFAGTTTPAQLPLVKLETKARTQERLIVVGTIAPFAGYNSGIPKKFVQEVTVEKISPLVYKVSPAKELADGEYAFCFFPSDVRIGTPGRLFTFSVKTK